MAVGNGGGDDTVAFGGADEMFSFVGREGMANFRGVGADKAGFCCNEA